MKKTFLIISGLLFLCGCGSGYYGRGWQFLDDKDYTNAKDYFQKQLHTNENDYNANLGLGLAYYFLDDFNNSLTRLEKANSAEPQKSEVKYYLGLCHESMKEYDAALKYYEYYKNAEIDSKYKSGMEERYKGILKLKFSDEAKSLISREKQIQGAETGNTLAILSFENGSGNPEYDPLRIGFPTMFITDFSLLPGLQVIERLRLQALLDEINLNKGDVFDKSTVQRAGKLIAAKQILKGTFKIINNTDLTLDLAVIDVQTGEVKYPESRNTKLDNFFRVEKEIVLSIADKMGMKISEETRRKILTIPTESFFNFLERFKKIYESEKMGLVSASQTMEVTAASKVSSSPTLERLNSLDLNTGAEKSEKRTDIPSRFLPDPPLPPE